jgi:integrase
MLTDAKIRSATASDKPVRLSDGQGLYLEISPAGGKLWRFKYRFAGKEKRQALGTYPDTCLKAAREKAAEAKKLLGAGVDPGEARKAEKAGRLLLAANSFEAIAREWLATVLSQRVSEGHSNRTRIRLEQDVFPWIGHLPIAEISAPLILQTMRRVESRGAVETAHRELQSVGQVFRYAVATGRAERDPTRDLRGALRPFLTRHMPAITDPKRVGDLLRAIHVYEGMPVTRAALRLAPLVFVRPGELRHAQWAEFDLDGAMWRIPAARMKRKLQDKVSGPDHFVPLPRQAIEILKELRPLTGHRAHVFPCTRGQGRPMSDVTIGAALRRLGFPKEEMTGHGFRAMARTLLAERLGVDEAVIEAQLAHAVRDSLGRAYNRTTFLAQRRAMLQTWADYLDRLRLGAEVVELHAAR